MALFSSRRGASLVVLALGIASLAVIVWMLFADGLQLLMDFVAGLIPEQSSAWFVGVYVLLCILSLWLIIPSGSLLLIAAGFALGTFTATLIYSVLHCLFCWPVYALAKAGLFHSDKVEIEAIMGRFFPAPLQRVIRDMRDEPFASSMVLRLTPVIPNAVACIGAVSLGIRFAPFFVVTVLVSWVRPIFYAAVGASLNTISQLREPMELVQTTNILPLFGVFFGACLLLAIRLWLRRLSDDYERTHCNEPDAAGSNLEN